MLIDARGRIDNATLSPSKCLAPVFEAIANATDAIEDRGNTDGRVVITVIRDQTQGVLRPDARDSQPVRDIIIEDNGIGFTDDNYRSFDTSDSRFKAKRGGKGVGRLLWLKAFQKARVESVYSEGRDRKLRTFDFTYSEKGIENLQVTAARASVPIGTKVSLLGFRSNYQAQCPKSLSALATRIIEHCLESLISPSCPLLLLVDSTDGTEIDLKKQFAESVESEPKDFEIDGKQFRINHVRLATRLSEKHLLHFCAKSRSVKAEALAGQVPNLDTSLVDPETGKPFMYAGYVSSDYLTSRVTPERTDFTLPTNGEPTITNEINWQTVVDKSVEQATDYLARYTEAIKTEKEALVRKYVNEQRPEYRPLLKHRPEVLDRIPPRLPLDKLDVKLYELNQEYDSELQARYREIVASLDDTSAYEQHKAHFEEFLEEWNERGVSSLARYVAHRKATLSYLETRLRLKPDGKYPTEAAVHEVIFPLRTTSDDVPPERMNLWILDERLAYHHYLASDKYLDNLDAVDVDAHKRTDLLVFQHPFAFAEGTAPAFGSIVLVEFKRPARNDYTDDENPVGQVLGYLNNLRSGKTKDRHGRPLAIPASLPIHAIIVCDITDRLRHFAKDHDFEPCAGGNGFFRLHKGYQAFIEIMSFETMLDNAHKRNRILFEKLGMGSDRVARIETPSAPQLVGEPVRSNGDVSNGRKP